MKKNDLGYLRDYDDLEYKGYQKISQTGYLDDLYDQMYKVQQKPSQAGYLDDLGDCVDQNDRGLQK